MSNKLLDKKGFTLIELLIVVVIIGLLASVLLVSIRNAIRKARDARIISAISEIRNEAEIYYDNQSVPTYVGLDTNDVNVTAAKADANANGGNVKFVLSQLNYTIWSVLASSPTAWYCIDATGFACKLSAEPAPTATKCGCPNEP